MLVDQPWRVPVLEFINERRLWVRSYISGRAHHVLLISFGWFVRSRVREHTTAVFWAAASRICLKQHEEFLCRSHFTLKKDKKQTISCRNYNRSRQRRVFKPSCKYICSIQISCIASTKLQEVLAFTWMQMKYSSCALSKLESSLF